MAVMRVGAGWALVIAVLMWGGGAVAATLTNRDAKDYKITVIEGQKTQDHVVKPAAILEGICVKGCVIRLNDSENDEYELEGPELVSIEEGYLYYDIPDTLPDTGAAGATAGQGAKPEPSKSEPGKPEGEKR